MLIIGEIWYRIYGNSPYYCDFSINQNCSKIKKVYFKENLDKSWVKGQV